MGKLGLNPNDFKHIKSDDKSTTLQHKNGHTLTIQHNVIGDKDKAVLSALANAKPDKNPYGKVIQKANGGNIPSRPDLHKKGTEMLEKKHKMSPEATERNKAFFNKAEQTFRPAPPKEKFDTGGFIGSTQGNTGSAPAPASKGSNTGTQSEDRAAEHEKASANSAGSGASTLDQVVNRISNAWAEGGEIPTMYAEGGEANYAYDAGLPCLNPHCKSHGKPHPNCRCYSSSSHFAKGGEVSKLRYCAHGMPHQSTCSYSRGGGVSEQGKDVRHGINQKDLEQKEMSNHFAKEEAKGRAQMERAVKPKMQGLAQGGPVRRYAEGTDEPIVPYGMRKEDMQKSKSSIDKLIDMKHAESAPKDEADTERDMDKYEASQGPTSLERTIQDKQQSRQAGQVPSPTLQPGMPGYNEPSQPIDDTDQPPTGSNQIDHGNDHYGHLDAQGNDQSSDQNDSQAEPPAVPGQQATAQMQQPSEQAATQIPQNAFTPAPEAPDAPPDLAQQHVAENQAFQQDLNNGHITPKTYNDLMYHNKDGSEKSTLGKIGSIFGLMLGGMGSGLTHSPNVAMTMMDNVIKNDLEAQKTSKSNAQNYLKINQQRLMNNAQVQSALAGTELTNAQKAAVIQGIQMKAYTQSYMDMSSVAVHKIIDQIKDMPDGPQKTQATQLAMLMAKASEENNARAAVMGAGGVNALGMYGVNGQQQQQSPQQQAEEKFKNDMQVMELSGQKDQADSLRARHLPGVPGFASAAVPAEEQTRFRNANILDQKVREVLDFAQKNRGATLATQEGRNAIATARQKAEELTAFYNGSTDNLGMTKGRLGWLEEQIKKNPTSIIQQIMGNNATLREIRDSNVTRKNQRLHDMGFPVQPPQGGAAPNPAKMPAEGTTGTHQGKPVIVKNGVWSYR